jgi:hypothetical protein
MSYDISFKKKRQEEDIEAEGLTVCQAKMLIKSLGYPTSKRL